MNKTNSKNRSDETHDEWLSQLKRGILELCVLSLLGKRTLYGYDICQRLAEVPHLEIAEGTLYPLLKRLKNAGYLQSKWRMTESGPPRNYYSLSSSGRKRLDALEKTWRAIYCEIDHFLKGVNND